MLEDGLPFTIYLVIVLSEETVMLCLARRCSLRTVRFTFGPRKPPLLSPFCSI